MVSRDAQSSSSDENLLSPTILPEETAQRVFTTFFAHQNVRLLLKPYQCFPLQDRVGEQRGPYQTTTTVRRDGRVRSHRIDQSHSISLDPILSLVFNVSLCAFHMTGFYFLFVSCLAFLVFYIYIYIYIYRFSQPP